MSQQRRGQEEAVSTPTDLCVIYSVLILLPQFYRNVAFFVTSDPPGAITSFIFLYVFWMEIKSLNRSE